MKAYAGGGGGGGGIAQFLAAGDDFVTSSSTRGFLYDGQPHDGLMTLATANDWCDTGGHIVLPGVYLIGMELGSGAPESVSTTTAVMRVNSGNAVLPGMAVLHSTVRQLATITLAMPVSIPPSAVPFHVIPVFQGTVDGTAQISTVVYVQRLVKG